MISAAAVALGDGAGDDDLLLGHAHAAELDREPLQRPRVTARGLGVGTRHLGHRVEAVEDVARQADRLGELGVDVDRVEVAGRARVAMRQVLVGGDAQLGERVALVQVAASASQTPRTMFVQVPRTTSSPSWFVETDSNT